jgi:hypothetical protein
MHYSDPGLRPVEFLRSVMHDAKADIHDRLRAAIALLEIEPYGPPKPSLTIKIERSQALFDEVEYAAFCDEQQAYFQSLPPHEQQEIISAFNRLIRCNELDVGQLDVTSEVKGHA